MEKEKDSQGRTIFKPNLKKGSRGDGAGVSLPTEASKVRSRIPNSRFKISSIDQPLIRGHFHFSYVLESCKISEAILGEVSKNFFHLRRLR